MTWRPQLAKTLFIYALGLNLLWSHEAIPAPDLHLASSTQALSIRDNPFQYSSAYTDRESSLQYLNARYYNTDIARFISRDTFDEKQKMNEFDGRYNYAADNPIMNNDPSGHDAEDTIKKTLKTMMIAHLALFNLIAVGAVYYYKKDLGALYAFNPKISYSGFFYLGANAGDATTLGLDKDNTKSTLFLVGSLVITAALSGALSCNFRGAIKLIPQARSAVARSIAADPTRAARVISTIARVRALNTTAAAAAIPVG